MGLFDRLKRKISNKIKIGLEKSSNYISQGLASVVGKKIIDETTLQEIEDLLISADINMGIVTNTIDQIKKKHFEKNVDLDDIKKIIANEFIKNIKNAKKFDINSIINSKEKPFVILFIGSNGSGKTTTLSKIAKILKEKNLKGRMVAGDTFRAAAIEQLICWGKKLHIPVETAEYNSDSSALIFKSLKKSQEEKDDYILIDTSGRMHNQTNLMAEINKIERVIKKINKNAPHICFLILDSTIGQNVYNQVNGFQDAINISAIIATKLDSTAKGGILLGVNQKFDIPIQLIGVGEGEDDLIQFSYKEFIYDLLELSD